MQNAPARPDRARAMRRRPGLTSMLWIGAALLVGAVGVTIVVHVQDRTGDVPPTSMFAAAAIVMSVLAVVTVTAAAYRAGTSFRAAVALGGAFAAIAIAKFGFGANALFEGNRHEEIQNVGDLSSGGLIVAIALVVGLLYVAVVWFLAVTFRPAPPPDGPDWKPMVAILLLGIGAAVLLAVFVTSAAFQYLSFAIAGLAASAIAITLFVAITLVAVAFHDSATRARALGTASMYITVAWIAIAFVLVFHVLWVVFLLAVVALWPLRSVTPK